MKTNDKNDFLFLENLTDNEKIKKLESSIEYFKERLKHNNQSQKIIDSISVFSIKIREIKINKILRSI